jgi:hypothetical protein
MIEGQVVTDEAEWIREAVQIEEPKKGFGQ